MTKVIETLIEHKKLSAVGEVIFTGIPGGYKYLKLICNNQGASTAGGDWLLMYFNGDTVNTNYVTQSTYWMVLYATWFDPEMLEPGVSISPSQSAWTNYANRRIFASTEITIRNYDSSSLAKVWTARSTGESSVSSSYYYPMNNSGTWHAGDASPITTIKLVNKSSGNEAVNVDVILFGGN